MTLAGTRPSARGGDATWRAGRVVRLAALAAVAIALSFTALLEAGDVIHAPIVWPVNAIIVAALLQSPQRAWPALLGAGVVGLVIAGALTERTLVPLLGLAVAHAVEIAVCAWALRRWCGTPLDLSKWRNLARFGAVSSLLAPLASAGAIAGGLAIGGETDIFGRASAWWAADALGLLILTPAFVSLPRRAQPAEGRRISTLALLSLVTLTVVTAVVFGQTRYPLLFIVPPALLLVAVQLEQPGATLGLLIVTFLAVGATVAGLGPMSLTAGGPAERTLILQAFLAVCALATLTVATIQRKRGQLNEALRVARDEARTHADRAQAAESAAGVGHWRSELDTGQVSWSPQVYQILGLAPDQGLNGRAAAAMIHPDDRRAAEKLFEQAVATGRGWDHTILRVIRPTGYIAYVASRGFCEMGPTGAIKAVFGTVMDVTKETLAEQSIRESEARYRLLAENATDAITRAGLDGRLLYVSAAVQRLTGYVAEDLLGGQIWTFAHPDDAAQLQTAYEQVGKGARERGTPIEYRVRHRLGTWMWVECNPTLVRDADGAPEEIVDVVRDVTGRKALEAELRAARDEAEAAAAVKAEFLANMSHELRTPLTSILGFARMIAEQPGLTPLVQGYVTRVVAAGDALLCTVNDILDFSKLEAGQVEIRVQPTSPKILVQSALEMFTPQAAAKDVSLRFEDQLEPGLTVSADPDRLRQILLNLIGNGVKFTERGSVTVVARHDGECLQVEVVDTGPGISPEKLPLLFRRFSQVNGSRTRSHGGTGLGLAICKGLVDAMGGAIEVSSTLGEGCRFSCSIPAAIVESAEEAQPETIPEMARPEGLRVLVADDHPANRELARLFLGALGADVGEATDGQDAVGVAGRAHFDVILMDISMPRLDGIAAAQAIRGQPGPNNSTPILAFTAAVDEASLDRLSEFNFAGVVAKPIDPQALLHAVATAYNESLGAEAPVA